jgi:hypothetical protein
VYVSEPFMFSSFAEGRDLWGQREVLWNIIF